MGALLGGAAHDVHLDLGTAGTLTVPVAPYVPADATRLDPAAVVRTVPPADVTDFEPNLFPAIELAHPALPWMLSPPADAKGRVMPWLVLVVVEDRPGVALDRSGGTTMLTIDAPADPARELPDLTQAWAWAHAQAVGIAGEPLDTADFLRSRGEGRARLIAPRRLVAGVRYIACLVPTFAAGVASALGLPIPSGSALAWATPPSAPVRLPVFHAWRFGTADGGDFASLAARLKPYELDAGVGHTLIDASAPGWGMPTQPGITVDVPGALVSSKWRRPDRSAGEVAIGEAILAAIDAAADAAVTEVPVYPPTFYGATATRTARTADSPTWQDQQNRDLGQRIAAGLGAAVVRAAQNELVEAAWQAAGEAERATIVIRQCEFAVAVAKRLVARHIAALAEDGDVLGISRPALARLRTRTQIDGTRPTIRFALERSAMPTAALSPSLRRLARPGSVVGRRAPVRAGIVLEGADSGAIQSAPPVTLPDGAAALDAVSKDERMQPRWRSATVDAIREASVHWHAEIGRRRRTTMVALRRRTDIPDAEVDTTPPLVSDDPDATAIDQFTAAARRHQAYLYGTIHPPQPPRPLGDAGVSRPLAALRASIVASLEPQPTHLAFLHARIMGVESATLENFESVLARPVLERPLIQALARLDPERVLPNVGSIEVDTVAIALPDPAMVCAFLVGANDELGRELLWRGFPGALGHTWLRTFWGCTTFDATGRPIRVPDIDAIESWPDAGPAIKPAQLVLVVRGELLRRYPNALVYAVAARWSGSDRVIGSGAPMIPVIAQPIATDIALFGFELDAPTAIGGDTPGGPAGWYFVIEEHPAEPRFGLAATSTTPLATWRDLSWFDVQLGDLVGEYLRVDGPLGLGRPTTDDGLVWGHDAAQLAAITLRRPTRVAFHASTLI